MKINAATRLRANAVEAVTYEQYCRVVAGLNEHDLRAFEFKVPGILKALWSDLKEIATNLQDGIGVGMDMIVKAFQEKSVFGLLKGVGFSLMKLLKAIKSAAAIMSQQLFHAIEALHKAGAFTKVEKSAKVVDEYLREHPILKKVTGLAVAGILLIMYLKSSFLGDVDRDLSLVDEVLGCLHANYSIYDLFASPDGLYAIATVAIGLMTGASAVSYGYKSIEKSLEFMGAHGSTVYNLGLSLFYAGARRAKLHVDTALAPKALTV